MLRRLTLLPLFLTLALVMVPGADARVTTAPEGGDPPSRSFPAPFPRGARVSPAFRAALAHLVEAFGDFEAAAAGLRRGDDIVAAMARVSEARQGLLAAALDLQADTASGAVPAGVQTPCLDLDGVDRTYTTNCALLVDVGGNDTYANNAGGVNGGAAALIDLGGNDSYGGNRSLGANGGGVAGAGFLFDAAGDDSYSAGGTGVNGGGYFFGSGFLLDGGGTDQYTASADCGTNGGGCSIASGTLVDLGSGSDSYSATRLGVNGGSAVAGQGLLVDAGGTDTYSDQEPCSGSGVDRTVAPKGEAGAQVDGTDPSPSICLPPSPPLPPIPNPQLGSVAGKVTDSRTKAGIVGALVHCGNADLGVALVDGRYTIPAARTGSLECTASAVGYQSRGRTVTVTAGATTTADFALKKL